MKKKKKILNKVKKKKVKREKNWKKFPRANLINFQSDEKQSILLPRMGVSRPGGKTKEIESVFLSFHSSLASSNTRLLRYMVLVIYPQYLYINSYTDIENRIGCTFTNI